MHAARTWLPGRHVRVYPVDQITSINRAGEAHPRDAGLDPGDIDIIWDSVLRLYRTGLHPAIALCLMRRGQVVLDRAVGHLRGNSPDDPADAVRVPIRHDSLFNLFSASKAMTAMLVHLLDERGVLGLDVPVARYLPAFARHGKHAVTLRQILTHRAGISTLRVPSDLGLLARSDEIFELLCDAQPASAPGRRPAYQALTGGYITGAVIEKLTGESVRQLLEREISRPLGLALSYGVPEARLGEVAENAFTGAPPVPPMSWMFRRAVGVSVEQATALSNHPAFLTAVVPSGNVIGTAAATCRFFELLRTGGAPVFRAETVARAVAPAGARVEIDGALGLPIRYGAGFMLGGDRISLYGPRTRRAFGHIGFSNVVAWADPDREVSACLMTSGKPFITPGQVIWLNVARTITKRCSR